MVTAEKGYPGALVKFGISFSVMWRLVATCALLAGGAAAASGVDMDTRTGPTAEQARAAIVQAEAAVSRAAKLRALWTNAHESLERARAAFARGDFAAARESAHAAREFAELGVAQLQYPPSR
jgi:hypothetical protein